jgi:flagellar basal body-associated protein FliL
MKKMLKGKRKLVVVGTVLVLVLGAGYTMAKKPAKGNERVKGTIYQLPQSFLLNLESGQYAKINVALLLPAGQSASSGEAPKGGSAEAEAGTLPEEPVVRAIITNAITGQTRSNLVEERGRVALEHKILKAINTQTDVKVEAVLFPDLTVQ